MPTMKAKGGEGQRGRRPGDHDTTLLAQKPRKATV